MACALGMFGCLCGQDQPHGRQHRKQDQSPFHGLRLDDLADLGDAEQDRCGRDHGTGDGFDVGETAPVMAVVTARVSRAAKAGAVVRTPRATALVYFIAFFMVFIPTPMMPFRIQLANDKLAATPDIAIWPSEVTGTPTFSHDAGCSSTF